MSSRTTSPTSSSTSTSTTPSEPSFSKLTHHLHNLVLLARMTLTPAYNAAHRFRYMASYHIQRDGIAAYFSRYREADFDGVFLCVLEMGILLRLIERGLGVESGKVNWPACGLGGDEVERLKRLAYERVEGWVFRGEEKEEEEIMGLEHREDETGMRAGRVSEGWEGTLVEFEYLGGEWEGGKMF